MIFNLILSAVTAILTFVFGLLPTYTAPSWLTYDLGGYALYVGSFLYKIKAWIPVEPLGIALQWVGTIVPIVVSAIVIMWLWAMMPIVGKKG